MTDLTRLRACAPTRASRPRAPRAPRDERLHHRSGKPPKTAAYGRVQIDGFARLVFALAMPRHGFVQVSVLAELAGISRATAYRHLQRLESAGWIFERDGAGGVRSLYVLVTATSHTGLAAPALPGLPAVPPCPAPAQPVPSVAHMEAAARREACAP